MRSVVVDRSGAGAAGHPATDLVPLPRLGELVGYRFGRVIRLKASDVEEFIEASRPTRFAGHLYPPAVGDDEPD